MADNDRTTGERSSQARLVDALPTLLTVLRQAEFQVGTEQFVAACDVLVSFTATGHTPSVTELRATLASVFCTSPGEQERFPEVFEPWYRTVSGEGSSESSPSKLAEPVHPPTWPFVGRPDRLRAWLIAGAVCVLLAGLGWYLFSPPVEDRRISDELNPPAQTEPNKIADAPAPHIQRLTPREPPEAVVPLPAYRPWWSAWAHEAWLGGISLWGLWVGARLWLRHVVLTRRRQRRGEQIRLESLRVAGERGDLFSAPLLGDTWRHLRHFRTMRSARLNESATIDRTLEAGGYFRPVYRDRQVPPAYLFLVDRRHGEDHAAEMATELGAALSREQIPYAAFDYHEDPRYCTPVGEIAAERGPAGLAGVYGDRTLFLVGDGDALFDPDTDRPQAWMQEFASFERKYLLTTDPTWRQHHRADNLAQAGFQVLPLTTQGLSQLTGRSAPMGADDPRDLPLPRRFAISPDSWLEERSLTRPVLRAILRELKEYLGTEGFLLLSATAAYPGLYWRLTRAVDLQLGLAPSARGLRLRKLGRLPWYRYGRMPDTLRIALLRNLDRRSRRRISNAYHALIEHRTDDPLRLPVAVPDWRGARAELREISQSSPRHETLGDRVFADVIRGRKPRALEFGLPAWWMPLLNRQEWRGLIGPALLGLVVIPAAIWLNVWAWHSWVAPMAERQALTAMQEQHRQVRVQISSPEDFQLIAQALERALDSWGFQIDRLPTSVSPPALTRERTRVLYRPSQKTMADVIAERVAYLSYGLKPLVEQDKTQSLSGADILVELGGRPRDFHLVNQVKREPFEASLTKLTSFPTRHSTSESFAEAATWAQNQLNKMNYKTQVQTFTVGGGISRNIIADKPGADDGTRNVVIVTANLDSINVEGGAAAPAPGADANGSGSAGLLEIARVFQDHRGRHDLRLILFGGKEQGLFGSKHYVAGLPASERARIRAVVNMDMIGSVNGSSHSVLLEGAPLSQRIIDELSQAAATYTNLTVETSLNPFSSDHVAFIEAGIPAVLTIEGADSANGNIHSSRDTIDKIDYDLALEILRINIAYVASELAHMP